MRLGKPRTVWVIVAMVTGVSTLALLLQPLRRERAFHVPDAAEAREAERFFGSALNLVAGNAGNGPMQAGDAARFGLNAARLASPDALTLAEPDGECAGRGAYLLRRGKGLVPVAITAPHRGADLETGPLARGLFDGFGFAAAAWNSAPRKGAGAGCPEGGDVAREGTHTLTSFSLAFARRYPQGRVVQLHGFDGDRRLSGRASEADAIVSDGTQRPSARLLDLAECLSARFPERRIAVFPFDTRELGGTSNAQGKALRKAGFGGFTHLEMSLPFRRALITDPDALARFAACLGAEA